MKPILACECAIAACLTFLALATAAEPHTLTGKCIAVTDGDTLTILVGETTYKIRLAEIDAPEMRRGKSSPGQPFSEQAKAELARLCFGKSLTVKYTTTDRYGRIIGHVWKTDQPKTHSLNTTLVIKGLAWWYRKYSTSGELEAFEVAARYEKYGLWKEPKPEPPWAYRQRIKREQAAVKAARGN